MCTLSRTCTSRQIITATVTAAMQKIKEQSAAYCRVAAGRQAVTARRERERLLEHTHTISAWARIHTHTTQTRGRWDMSPGTRTYSSVISLFYKIHLNRLSQDSQRQRMLPFYTVNLSHIGFFILACLYSSSTAVILFSYTRQARSLMAYVWSIVYFYSKLYLKSTPLLWVWDERTGVLQGALMLRCV